MPKPISGNTYAADSIPPVSAAQIAAELKALFDAAVDGIIVIDVQGVIAEFNKAAERLFGHKAADVVGSPVTVLMAEPHRGLNHSNPGDIFVINTGQL